MWDISARLQATLTGTHTVVAKAEILYDGDLVATVSPEGNDGLSQQVRLVDGTVDVQRAVVRRQGTVTFFDPGNELAAVLVPLRGEVRLWRGAVYADATATEKASPPADREYVPLATLVVTTPRAGAWPQDSVAGFDRMWWVGRQRFVTPYKVPPGITVATAMVNLLASRLTAGRRQLDIPDTGQLTNASTSLVFDEQADPAEALSNMAAAVGQVIYSDPMGTILARAEPQPDPGDAVLSLTPGPGSVMLRPVVTRDVSGLENAVVATGEAPDLAAPVRGYAEDSDPTSLTYAAAVGVVPRFFSSPLLRTNEQARLAALTVLRTQLGVADTVIAGMLPNPALDAGDILWVEDPDQGLATAVIIDSFSIGLRTSGPMSLSCRTATVSI